MGTARSLTASAVAGAVGFSAATCGACRATRMPLVLVFFFPDFPPVPLCSGGLFALAAGLRGRALFFAGLPISKVASWRQLPSRRNGLFCKPQVNQSKPK